MTKFEYQAPNDGKIKVKNNKKQLILISNQNEKPQLTCSTPNEQMFSAPALEIPES